jgi:hypothetical protein
MLPVVLPHLKCGSLRRWQPGAALCKAGPDLFRFYLTNAHDVIYHDLKDIDSINRISHHTLPMFFYRCLLSVLVATVCLTAMGARVYVRKGLMLHWVVVLCSHELQVNCILPSLPNVIVAPERRVWVSPTARPVLSQYRFLC